MEPRRAAIDDFLAHKRIAFVGLSTHERDFSRSVYEVLEDNDFDVVPVNPGSTEIDGHRCYSSVEEIDPPVEGALIMTARERVRDIVEQCDRAGIERVWLHRGGGHGAVSDEAVDYCQEHHMSVIPGECPLMFVGHPDAVHRAHASLRRFTGTFPDEEAPWFNGALVYLPVLGWMLCGLVMYAGLAWLSATGALIAHAVAAPIIFAALARRYYRLRNHPNPIITAAVFTGLVILLDAFVVALLIEGSFAMFASPLGTWIPFAAMFGATWLTGLHCRR
jgi:predicted CoA-binding protein